MSKTTTIELGDYFKQFISRQIEVGRFASDSEVVKEGLRLLEEKESRLEALRKALVEGEQSGFSPVPFDLDEFLADMRSEETDPP